MMSQLICFLFIFSAGVYGTLAAIDSWVTKTSKPWQFNAYNLLAVYGTAMLLGENTENVLTILSELKPPPGRFEQIMASDQRVGIVDYAHTPNAQQKALESARLLVKGDGKLIHVFGCAGRRDFYKRPED
jgi:UDP-N-acetylmuramoyl-L-alanyl-D-glutamate--2,6-diaminopimelate ligase